MANLWAIIINLLIIGITIVSTTNDSNVNLFDTAKFTHCFSDKNESTSIVHDVESTSKQLVFSSNTFAFQLFKQLNKFEIKSNSSGLIYSPSSLYSTLILTYLGSRGDTERELRNRLKLNDVAKSSIAIAFRAMQLWNNLKSTKSTNSSHISDVNKLFVASQLKINSCVRDLFPDYIEAKDFVLQPAESLDSINEWISQHTAGKINNLLPIGSITPMTKLIMTNAIYFKSNWAQQFDSSKTQKAKFHVSSTEELEVDMMSMESISLMYGISEELQVTAVEIPYSSSDYSMVVLLPTQQEKGLDSLLREINSDNLQDLLHNMVDDDINLSLPKFKAEQEFELAGPLYSIGIKKLFDPRYVNLSVIFEDEKDSRQSALNSVLHKSYINVNEEGTEASAATAMIFARSGRPLFPTQFIANRPFLYLIRDTTSNLILFMGTVRRPNLNNDPLDQ
ncbi:hypothetical protein RDWZM_001084 [Blomia tropicalis]|uniref:Serpin domain-containing protein n=1 Tax=Blomia tropicalis TaxID=40697 RepID=A0A9Q0MBE5_BLOTA|nr:hypothetical protein RDWZM_001084 [Blomia tropicalis]